MRLLALCAVLTGIAAAQYSPPGGGGSGAGVSSVHGTANQISTSGNTGSVTLSVPSPFGVGPSAPAIDAFTGNAGSIAQSLGTVTGSCDPGTMLIAGNSGTNQAEICVNGSNFVPLQPYHSISFQLVPSATGDQGVYAAFPFACNAILGWTIASQSGTSGSISISLYKANGAIPTTGSTLVTASAPIVLSSANWNSSTSVGTWVTAIAPGDTFLFDVTSYSTLTGVNGTVYCQ